jgi:hypothetical protein
VRRLIEVDALPLRQHHQPRRHERLRHRSERIRRVHGRPQVPLGIRKPERRLVHDRAVPGHRHGDGRNPLRQLLLDGRVDVPERRGTMGTGGGGEEESENQ